MTTQEKKVVVVAGALGYVGKAIVKELDMCGMRVALLYHRTKQEEVEDFMGLLKHTQHKSYHCDLTQELDVRRVLHAIEEDLGSLDSVVDASGSSFDRKKITEISFDEVSDYFDTSLRASYVFLSESAKFLKEKKSGTVVGITTIGVLKSEATKSMGAYLLAKYAEQGFLTLLREELKSFGVKVFSIAPGFLPGGINNVFPKAFFDIVRQKSETKKITTAEDVAVVVARILKEGDDNGLTIPVAFEYKSL